MHADVGVRHVFLPHNDVGQERFFMKPVRDTNSEPGLPLVLSGW